MRSIKHPLMLQRKRLGEGGRGCCAHESAASFSSKEGKRTSGAHSYLGTYLKVSLEYSLNLMLGVPLSVMYCTETKGGTSVLMLKVKR